MNNNKKVLLFWYPKDFTYVCPTELHAFQESLPEFEKRNTIVIGASCDTAEVHFAWLSTAKDNGGIEGVTEVAQEVTEVGFKNAFNEVKNVFREDDKEFFTKEQTELDKDNLLQAFKVGALAG